MSAVTPYLLHIPQKLRNIPKPFGLVKMHITGFVQGPYWLVRQAVGHTAGEVSVGFSWKMGILLM